MQCKSLKFKEYSESKKSMEDCTKIVIQKTDGVAGLVREDLLGTVTSTIDTM